MPRVARAPELAALPFVDLLPFVGLLALPALTGLFLPVLATLVDLAGDACVDLAWAVLPAFLAFAALAALAALARAPGDGRLAGVLASAARVGLPAPLLESPALRVRAVSAAPRFEPPLPATAVFFAEDFFCPDLFRGAVLLGAAFLGATFPGAGFFFETLCLEALFFLEALFLEDAGRRALLAVVRLPTLAVLPPALRALEPVLVEFLAGFLAAGLRVPGRFGLALPVVARLAPARLPARPLAEPALPAAFPPPVFFLVVVFAMALAARLRQVPLVASGRLNSWSASA